MRTEYEDRINELERMNQSLSSENKALLSQATGGVAPSKPTNF